MSKPPRLSRRRLALGGVAVLFAAATITGGAVVAAFFSNPTASHTVIAGAVDFSLSANDSSATAQTTIANMMPGDVGERLLTISNASDGLPVGNMSLTETGPTLSGAAAKLLDSTDGTNLTADTSTEAARSSLMMVIERCSVQWTVDTGTRGAAGAQYSCSGTTTVVADGSSDPHANLLPNITLNGNVRRGRTAITPNVINFPLTDIPAPGATDYYRVTYFLGDLNGAVTSPNTIAFSSYDTSYDAYSQFGNAPSSTLTLEVAGAQADGSNK